MMGFGMGFGFIGLLLMVLFWGSIISFFARLVHGGGPQGMGAPMNGGLRPREILDQRYARGEISREEYERMKQDLR